MIMQEEQDGRKMVYAIIRDATSRYELESQQYAMFKAMPGGFIRYSCDELEEVTFVSDGLLELLELTREEFAERYHDRFSPMVYEEDRERVLGEIDDQIGDQGTWDTCKYRVLTKSGQLRWVYDAAYVTEDSNGRRWFNVVILDLSTQTEDEDWVSA
ncbi:MAG: PAS domain-containing protein, partial [Coriobacteriales bacterium]|nr:PAS domain-containing protein [Coriobacteriales bacterium]